MELSQTEIARKSGISTSFMCDILHERKKPSALVAERLEEVTDVELIRAWLMPQKYYNQLIHKVIGDGYSFIQSNLQLQKKGEEKHELGRSSTETEEA